MTPNVGKARVDVTKTPMPIYDNLIVREDDWTEEVERLYARLKIDRPNISNEAEEQPTLFARIGFIAEEAIADANYLKRQLEIAKAEADSRIRRGAAAAGEKKPTEDEIKKAIVLDEDVQKAELDYLDADRVANLLVVVKQSFKDRRDLIVELMRNARQESAGYGGTGGE